MEIIYTVKYHPLVVHDDIPALDAAWRSRIKTAIETKLVMAPDVFGIPLRRSLKGHRKLRVGDYRIVFRIEKKTVLILAILHRSVVYQRTPRRIG
ncbi:MAG: type II toxin-antitoxin system RelE/ParE family toxin [Patescibacteria group bacterium]|jgi:mRNA interferase RelE/StbE